MKIRKKFRKFGWAIIAVLKYRLVKLILLFSNKNGTLEQFR